MKRNGKNEEGRKKVGSGGTKAGHFSSSIICEFPISEDNFVVGYECVPHWCLSTI